jgi:cyclohexanecarboxylate-CoA ligase/acyl-CoA synthetase
VDATLTDWLDRWAHEAPDRPAILTPAPVTYAELRRRTRALAAGFSSLGIAKGDIVAAQLPNSAEFLLCYLAAASIGATLQTIHMPYRGAEIETLLAHSKAAAVVCVSRAKDSPAELILSLKAKLPHLRHVVAIGDAPPPGVLPFASVAATEPSVTTARPAADDRFLLLYTSGTTAAPKGVPIIYRKFLTNALLSAAELKIDAASILLSAAPFTHLYGLFSVNLALSVGAAIAILPAFTPAALAATMDACRPTGLFVAPAHMAACLNEGLLTPERFASLHFALISGSVCAPSLALAVEERMTRGKALQLWGMSEMQAGTYTRPDDPIAVRSRTAGRASPGTQLRIADDMAPLGAGQEGELQVRGISVFEGYLDNPDATAAAFTLDGWFRTGDLARLDENHNLELTGRLKDVINRGGVKFNPTDIEALIERHPSVAQCAIVPTPDPVLGEKACCFVVLKPGAALDLDALRVHLESHAIAKLKWPERLELIDEMPLTPTRKIKKADLTRLAAATGS